MAGAANQYNLSQRRKVRKGPAATPHTWTIPNHLCLKHFQMQSAATWPQVTDLKKQIIYDRRHP
jgi:hypothetical protein